MIRMVMLSLLLMSLLLGGERGDDGSGRAKTY